jgi:adenylate kinase family enzyme
MVGNSGSGKSTLARELAASLGVPHLELDSVFHQPGWEPLPEDEFRRLVTARANEDGWVIDGNYSAVRSIVWARADTVVWLDLPKWTVMRQVAWRTVRRAVTQQELWNGNREPLSNFLTWNQRSPSSPGRGTTTPSTALGTGPRPPTRPMPT